MALPVIPQDIQDKLSPYFGTITIFLGVIAGYAAWKLVGGFAIPPLDFIVPPCFFLIAFLAVMKNLHQKKSA